MRRGSFDDRQWYVGVRPGRGVPSSVPFGVVYSYKVGCLKSKISRSLSLSCPALMVD